MIEYIIAKSLGGLEQVSTFKNRYLYDGVLDITSAASRNILLDLVSAEQLLYPTTVSFVRGIIREVTNKGEPIKGRTRSVPLEATGLFAIPVGDKLAPAHICAVIERQASLGRPGYGYYRHCVTIGEYEEWVQDKTTPARFDTGTVTIGGNTLTFWQQLAENIGAGELVPVLPDAWGDELNVPRVIAGINFGGFRINDPKRPKKSARVELAQGLQAELNETGRLARQLWREAGTDIFNPANIPGAVELVARALRIYWSAPDMLRGRLRRPKIFKELPWANPGGIPQLPFGG